MPIQVQIQRSAQRADPAAEREKLRQRRFWTVISLISACIAVIIVLRLYAFQATVITSGSMDPTIKKGDYALFDHRVALRGHWNRGDVIIFKAPPSWEEGGQEGSEQAGSFANQLLCKRIIGLPGEHVSIVGGAVRINGKPLTNENYIKEVPVPQDGPEFDLGPNQYVVMGDNRNNSDDSRSVGPISESDIEGRVVRRLWPLSRAGALPPIDYKELNTDK